MIFRNFGNVKTNKRFSILFYSLFICSLGMVASFAQQGYGLISIILSTISLVLNYFMIGIIFNTQRKSKSKEHSLLYAALFFNLLSTLGTLFLAFLMASKTSDAKTMNLAVQFYLHFQFNGWFIVGALYLVQQTFKDIFVISQRKILFLSISILLSFNQTLLPIFQNNLVITLSVISTICQLIVFITILKPLIDLSLPRFQQSFLKMILGFLLFKLSLQVIASIPAFFELYFNNHPLTISYLHLIFLLIISNLIIFLFIRTKVLLFNSRLKAGIILFNFGIICTELLLVLQGTNFKFESLNYQLALIVFSGIILVGTIIMAMCTVKNDSELIFNEPFGE